MKVDFDKMSVAELQKMAQDALRMAAEKKEAGKQDLIAAVKAQIADAGYTFEELFGSHSMAKPARAAKGEKGEKAAAKYRHPENPALTYSGRGRKPLWMVEALEKGGKMEDFAI